MTWTDIGLAAVIAIPALFAVGMILWPSPYAESAREEIPPAGVDPMPTQPLLSRQWLTDRHP